MKVKVTIREIFKACGLLVGYPIDNFPDYLTLEGELVWTQEATDAAQAKPVPAEENDDWYMCTLKDGCQHFTTFKGCECECHSPTPKVKIQRLQNLRMSDNMNGNSLMATVNKLNELIEAWNSLPPLKLD